MVKGKSSYNHEKIEGNWKDKWYKDNIYEAVDFSDKPKKYILAELPYPSGKSLHVGHMMRYTVPEIYSRFLRMKGFNVLFPMGWDSFGLPAETYAKKAGITPQEAIKQAQIDYKEAMQDIGYGIDWNRELSTADPKYYKWTQWTFKKLWEKGLAKQKEMPVWWCDELGVLADEEVLPDPDGDGKISERGSHKVERKMFKQWVLDIPSYGDRLVDDLDRTDYEESVKVAQKNWIGRKEGLEVDFTVEGEIVSVFTTRPDTLYGVTFLAISPEHPLINKLLDKAENKDAIKDYVNQAKSLSDLEKQTKEKTGVLIKGITAKNPIEEISEDIPLFVADYILSDYGTGVVMGVPGHDERDNEFAKKYDTKIIEVVSANESYETSVFTGVGVVKNSGEYDGMNSDEFKDVISKKLVDAGKARLSKQFKVRTQVFSRQRYWGEPIPLLYKEDGSLEAVKDTDLPLELPVMKDFLPGEDGVSPLKKNTKWNQTKDSEGNKAKRETDTMPTWAGSNWYYLRYIDSKNDEMLVDPKLVDYWFPIDMYFGDAGHTTAHVLYARFWFKFLHDIGVVPLDEPFDYRMSGGMLLGPDGQKMSKSKGNVVNPQEVLENYGADAVRTYLAFIGPYDETYPWNPRGLVACARLVKSIYEMKDKVVDTSEDEETLKKLNIMLKKITGMMDSMKMNTSVSEIMIFVNHLKKTEAISEDVWKKLILVIAPFMPFTAEELWQEINKHKMWHKENSVHLQEWPSFDEKLTQVTNIDLPVQINGKLRGTINVPFKISEEDIKKLVLEQFAQKIDGKDIKKFIYVPGKIVNLVV
jgi:leucyl-tRNA synthetase